MNVQQAHMTVIAKQSAVTLRQATFVLVNKVIKEMAGNVKVSQLMKLLNMIKECALDSQSQVYAY